MKPKKTLDINTKTTLAGCALALAMMSLTASAANLYTTTQDFAQFNGGTGVTSTTYYSVSGTVNGIGNQTNAGGAGTVGSLQLTAGGGWGGISNSDFPLNNAVMTALDGPGYIAPWSGASGYGPGTMIANSGTMTLDVYTGNFTDWSWFGITLNYNGYNGQAWPSTSSSFTGADGRTWTQYTIPYTINAVDGGLTYFQINLQENAGNIGGETFYIDNIQAQTVPEPTTVASLLGGIGMLVLRRRRGTC